MEDDKKLYPFKFCTLQDDYCWGSETFMLADLGYRDSLVKDGWLAGNSISEVMDMYMDRVVGENVFTWWGRQFPVQVKGIKVSGRMPLRVHPDDETASQRYDFLGKEKLWYICSAGEDARLMLGFAQDTDASMVYSACMDNSIEDMLNIVRPHAGEYYHIAPGTVHAASGDLNIIEISESSPLDFCLCGWGQQVSTEEFDPQLNLVDALDFISYKAYSPAPKPAGKGTLVDMEQFKVDRLELKEALHSRSAEYDSLIVYSCVKGGASIGIDVLGQAIEYVLRPGETMLIPAECPDFEISPSAPGTIVLETTIPHRDGTDAYINPEAEAEVKE